MGGSTSDLAAGYFGDALIAVLDLHEPQGNDSGEPWCLVCEDGDGYGGIYGGPEEAPYPCDTVRAIARELGVSDG
ncbi:hypothetical protein [Saccharopolyspora mangrovi]|uniref:Uncharacterized protein n=1 Tax=Saccharopolyspora mangrovi TaxID=3082379 RepID=A0ABU6A778_9PSEU|nr:hypothetical protein [Saccharopolyspora sp. S2-29]MEB3367390.1 hypothetical protein [Saccharopolyspora sp. S2-29]